MVELYTRYLNLIPRTGPFYRKPLDGTDENNNPKFGSGTISLNGLKTMLKRFFAEAGIDSSNRKITNHSARVALCTTLYNKSFQDKAVMSRSKHRSDAIHAYQREQFDILNNISGALEPEIMKPKQETITKPDTETENQQDVKSNIVTGSSADDPLVINVPKTVKNLVIVKSDGKKMIIDI